MKTICIAGKNDIAVNVLLNCIKNYKDNKIICVVNKNEKGINSWQKSLKWFAEKNNVEIVELDDVYNIEDLLFLSLEFDRIIRPNKFKSKELYNIHFSLLPKYKGMYTSILPILNDENHTGVTLHKIRSGIDTGEIIEQIKIPIDLEDTSFDIYKKCIENGTQLVLKNLESLINNEFECKKQSPIGSSYYAASTIDFSNISLNCNQTAYQIKNQIRAFCFRPYQLLEWNYSKYIGCKIENEMSEQKPGTILEDNQLFTRISTIDYNVLLYKDVFEELLRNIVNFNNEIAKKMCICHKTIEFQDKHGWSPLTVAVYNNNYEITKYLIQNGADINIKNNNGTNLLMYAKDCYVQYNDATIFDYLLSLGLDPKDKDYSGKNLYDYCNDEGIKSIGNFKI